MRLVGITGTNGKTTTATLLAHIVRTAGEPDARVTTLGSWVAGEQLSDQTDVDAFFRCIERAREKGVRTLIIEVTSQALAEGFAHRYPVDAAVLTSFSRDHLDYHGSPEQYLAAKAQLFTTLAAGGTAVLNASSEAALLIEELVPETARRLWFSPRSATAQRPCALSVDSVHVSREGTMLRLAPSTLAQEVGRELRLRVHGAHFAEDVVAAALSAHALDYPAPVIREALTTFSGVPGRFEVASEDPLVVVDYAHTPDALERTLRVARTLCPDGRVVVVFGCGGERDQGKRSEMGRVAAELAHVAILTSDNPRSESVSEIIAEIATGALSAGAREEDPVAVGRNFPSASPCILARIADRRAAIVAALQAAQVRKGSCVVVAGKGHEQVQLIGDAAQPFDDAGVVRELLSG